MSSNLYNVIIVFMVINLLSEVLSTAPFDAECTTDHGIVPDMTSCKRFILCINGRVVRRSKCSTGLLYDIDIGACNYEENVYCGTRSTQEPQCNNQECNIYNANVTIRVENTVVEPNFKLETTLTAPRQSLYNYLLMAAGKDNRFRFKTRPVETFGEFVTSFNGLEGTPETFSGWVSSTRRNRIHGVFPEDKEIITFKFYSFLQNLNPQTNIPNINNIK